MNGVVRIFSRGGIPDKLRRNTVGGSEGDDKELFRNRSDAKRMSIEGDWVLSFWIEERIRESPRSVNISRNRP